MGFDKIIVRYKTQTPTIYWNWLIQTLIITRLSSLGVGVSRTVMSDRRFRWLCFGEVKFREKDRNKQDWENTSVKMLRLKHFGKERSARRDRREGSGREREREEKKRGCNSLVKYWVWTQVRFIQISMGFTPSRWIKFFICSISAA